MNLLLDTHSYIWFSENNELLSDTAKQLIENQENRVFLSAASLWEIAIKISLHKLMIDKSMTDVMRDFRRSGIYLLPIDLTHIELVSRLPFHHRDPFNRIIAAQALCENMTLVGKDLALDAYGVRRLW